MHIGFDKAVLAGNSVGSYALNVLRHLSDFDERVQLRGFGFLGWSDVSPEALLKKKSAQSLSGSVTNAMAYDPNGMTREKASVAYCHSWRIKRFNRTYQRQNIDAFHSFSTRSLAPVTAGCGAPAIQLVHDLSYGHRSDACSSKGQKSLETLSNILGGAAHINALSNFSKAEISHIFGIKKNRISVTYPGVSSTFSPVSLNEANATLNPLDLRSGSYFLSVGKIAPGSNLDILVRAYLLLPDTLRLKAPLVIVGAKGHSQDDLKKFGNTLISNGQIRLVDHPTRDALAALYSHARLFLYPAHNKAFGRPLAEALACGAPIAYSNTGASAEIAQSLGTSVDELDTEAWARCMRGDDVGVAALMKEYPKRIARGRFFTWAKTARKTIAMYQRVVSQ